MVDQSSPKADMARCHQNEALIHAFGVFSFDQKENEVHYDKFSSEYDNMQTMTGFNDPHEIVKVCVNELGTAKDVRICDFGCGTGILGEELKKQGFTNVSGIDGSADMLKYAESKGVY